MNKYQKIKIDNQTETRGEVARKTLTASEVVERIDDWLWRNNIANEAFCIKVDKAEFKCFLASLEQEIKGEVE
jgi:hypothetical protein